MDLLLQVLEKELEEFLEPSVDHTDQDNPDRTNTGGTQSSNISHQLQTQTQTSTASEASKVLTCCTRNFSDSHGSLLLCSVNSFA